MSKVENQLDANAYVKPSASWKRRPRELQGAAHETFSPGEPDYLQPHGNDAEDRVETWRETILSRESVLAEMDALPIKVADEDEVRERRARSVNSVLDWLESHPGNTWQERWLASGIDDDERPLAQIVKFTPDHLNENLRNVVASYGVRWVLLTGLVRPAYSWIYRARLTKIRDDFVRIRDEEGFAKLREHMALTGRGRPTAHARAFMQLCKVMLRTGKKLEQLTAEELIHSWHEGAKYLHQPPPHDFYSVMYEIGWLGKDAPPSIRAARVRGPLSPAELVDRFNVKSPRIRDVFVAYLRERSVNVDYSTLSALSVRLVQTFWSDIEEHHPGIDDLAIDSDMYLAWRERLRTIRRGRRAGQERREIGHILLTVRAFYFDIANWAATDPARWGPYVAPNPIPQVDAARIAKEKVKARARSHARTRERAPHMPRLVRAVDERYSWAARMFAASDSAVIGDTFDVDGTIYRRVQARKGRAFEDAKVKTVGAGRYAVNVDNEQLVNIDFEEDRAFWTWAFVEVLRHTGVRIEELLELTHASIVSYRLPTTAELIPLLQIAPSKTDEERVLVVSPELANALAAIISRVRMPNGAIPLVHRYDPHERTVIAPQPFIMQRRIATQATVISTRYVTARLKDAVEWADIRDGAGRLIAFTPHDFRRMFATDAVASGLPIHIAAKILGHVSIETTQIYAAIYDEDVIRHHRAFIERRRQLRPQNEYREPTADEWDEFLGHFERRQLELGICGRAYGTPCIHEHACIRCSLLQVDPAAESTLRAIVENLGVRIEEARARNWLGEIEGHEVSRAAALRKLEGLAQQPKGGGRIGLGMPTIRVVEP